MLRQFWKKDGCFSCLGIPKRQQLLLYLDGCDAEYELPNGTKITAKSGNIVYTALDSQYKVKFTNLKNERSSTLGINFHLFNERREHLTLDKDVVVFNVNEEIVSCLERLICKSSIF